MPKAKNPEARIMEYFETEPIEAVRLLHNILGAVVKRRSPPRAVGGAGTGVTVRKKPKAKEEVEQSTSAGLLPGGVSGS